MRSKYLPISDTKSAHDRFSFPSAQKRIAVHRRHKDRSVLVIFGLLGGKASDIDINISRKSYMIRIIDKHGFPCKMTALALRNAPMWSGIDVTYVFSKCITS